MDSYALARMVATQIHEAVVTTGGAEMTPEMEKLLVRAIVQILLNQSKSEHHDHITSGGLPFLAKTRIFATATERLAKEIQEQEESEGPK